MKHTSLKWNDMNDNYLKCVKRSLEQDARVPDVSGLVKFCEETLNPLPHRPVVEEVGSVLHRIGR